MWLRRLKTKTRFQPETTPSVASPTFSLSSFKDIQSLVDEEDTNTNTNIFTSTSNCNNTTPKSRFVNVFHRVRFATSLFRAFSVQKKVEENVQNGQESTQTLNSLHGVGLEKEKDQVLIEEKEKDQVLIEEKEKDQVLIEEPTSDSVLGVSDVVRVELPGTETRVVIFFTSLRVVRSTFEDCKYARTILHSFPVVIDERDLFMDGSFMKELQRIMGIDEKTNLTLPRVFIGGRYIGGAEEVRQLHEAGELKKYLQGLAQAPGGTCEVCGGHGFILCLECSGSHKCYEDKGVFRTCSECNENGLVRCPSCSSAPL